MTDSCSRCRGLGVIVSFDGSTKPCGECGEEARVKEAAVKLLGEAAQGNSEFRRLAAPVFAGPGVPYNSDVLKKE